MDNNSVQHLFKGKNKVSKDNKFTKEIKNKNVKGVLAFILYFIVLTPYLLHRFYPNLLLYYVANIDMVANILTTINDPGLFSELYMTEPDNVLSYLSLNTINWIALMGIAYAISNITHHHSIRNGMIAAGIMYLVTFLLPTEIVPFLIKHVRKPIDKLVKKPALRDISKYITGVLFALSFILLESFLLKLMNID